MQNYQSLQHVFLIAMPQLQDPCFSQSVVYLWECGEQGAKGVIINKPVKARLGDLLRHLQIPIQDTKAEQHPMLLGGPVASEQGFLIQRKRDMNWQTGETDLQITVSSSRDDLVPLAEGEALADTLVALGYASWEPGQLEQELKNNDWLVAPFREETLFALVEDASGGVASTALAWYCAAATLGVDLNCMSLDAGHA